MVKVKHKIICRQYEYLSFDTYGYSAVCTCKKMLTGFSKKEVEDKITEHLTKRKIIGK